MRRDRDPTSAHRQLCTSSAVPAPVALELIARQPDRWAARLAANPTLCANPEVVAATLAARPATEAALVHNAMGAGLDVVCDRVRDTAWEHAQVNADGVEFPARPAAQAFRVAVARSAPTAPAVSLRTCTSSDRRTVMFGSCVRRRSPTPVAARSRTVSRSPRARAR